MIGRVAVLVAVLAGAGCTAAAVPRAPGDVLPPELGREVHRGAHLVWVLRPEDYLTCQGAADALRGAQRRHGARVRLTVLSVGPRPEWARAFLLRQRIEGDLRPLTDREFTEIFGARATSTLYLSREGVIEHAIPTRGGEGDPPSITRLVDELLRVRGTVPRAYHPPLEEAT